MFFAIEICSMDLLTQIPLSAKQPAINYRSKILLLGSCFTENIGAKFEYYQFQNWQNPFGIIFNPISIENLVSRAIVGDIFIADDIFEHLGVFHSFEVHSMLSKLEGDTLLNDLNKRLEVFKVYLSTATHIFITLGTSWVYRLNRNDEVVANCHRIPQSEFTKELLGIREIAASLNTLIGHIESVNKNATIIFTVSPVRHVKDGMIENSQSKAHLISAIHKVISTGNSRHYFPSYEIMMDELRDYRFYADDMLHPSEFAIQYLWEKLKNVWVDKDTEPLMKEIEAIQKGLSHRPFQPDSEAHQLFLSTLNERIVKLREKIPHLSFMT